MSPNELRRKCIAMLVSADDGHCGSVMSLVEMVAEIPETDHIVISEGHAAMVLYPILHERGLLTDEEIRDFRKRGSLLTMFPHKGIPGILVSCGSLGNGIGYACGLAFARRAENFVCIISEGELYEGVTWESLMFARHYNLSNLRVIVNKNDAITLGKPSECLDIPWKALEVFPFVEVRQTVKGKGVPEWEGKIESHYWIRPRQANHTYQLQPGEHP